MLLTIMHGGKGGVEMESSLDRGKGEGDAQGGGASIGGSVMGWTFNLRGRESIIIFVLVVLIGVIVYGAMQIASNVMSAMDQKGVASITNAIDAQTGVQTREHREITSAIDGHTVSAKAEHQAMHDAIRSLDATMQEQNFILLMTSEERRNIRLKMPPSLREKLIIGPSR